MSAPEELAVPITTNGTSNDVKEDLPVVQGLTLDTLKESILKYKGGKNSSQSRINRIKEEVDEINQRIDDQEAQNSRIEAEISKLKQRRDLIDKDIDTMTTKLNEITQANNTFVKDKVISPADAGILSATRAVEVFEEMKNAGFRLQLMLRRENVEKADAQTHVDWPYDSQGKVDDEAELYNDVLKFEEQLYQINADLREVKNISRGARPSKNSKFANITKPEWDARIEAILRTEEEAAALQTEIDRIDEEVRQKAEAEERRRREIESSVSSDVNDLIQPQMSAQDLIAQAMDSLDEDVNMYTPAAPAATPVEQVQGSQMQQQQSPQVMQVDEDSMTPYQSVYAQRQYD